MKHDRIRLVVSAVVALALVSILALDAPGAQRGKRKQRSGPQSIKLVRSLENSAAQNLYNEGNAFAAGDKYDEAIAKYDQALVLTRADKDRYGESTLLVATGVARLKKGEFRDATDLFNQGLAISKTAKDRVGQAAALYNLGLAQYKMDATKDVILGFYQQALVIYQEVADHKGEANTLFNMGVTYYWYGEIDRANEYYRKAEVARRKK